MKLPRDVNGAELVRALRRIGYEVVRQKGSHIIMQTAPPDPHSVTVPHHRPVRSGTLKAILDAIAARRGMTVESLIKLLDL
jgi:predicted RNA binding protein YcfA (HicA-like mRNA interferase family)